MNITPRYQCVELIFRVDYVEGNPGVLEINERATVAASEVTKATAAALEKAYGSTPFEIEFQEIVFTATKPAG